MSLRTVNILKKTIDEYLKRNDIFYEDAPWEIKESPLGGFGLFAKCDIDVRELIFFDSPVILGPRCAPNTPKICVNCFSRNNLQECKNNCGLPLCSESCQNSYEHRRECKLLRQMKSADVKVDLFKLLKCLTPLRSLLLSAEDKEVVRILKSHKGYQHGHEVEVLLNELMFDIKEDNQTFLKFVCSILDANAFEVITGNEDNQSSLRGLYPLGSLANHRCFPNTIHVFDDKQRMIVRASVFIQEGTEIFHSYSRTIWGTMTRIYHLLKTKHFLCKCERCCDPTEFRTYMSAIYCSDCKGKVVSINPIKAESNWECEDCKKIITGTQVGERMSLLGSVLRGCDDNGDVQRILNFLKKKLLNVVTENNQVVIEIKYKIIWILGYGQGFTWKEMPIELLYIKQKFCEDIVTLLEKLRTGQCKMRGLLLYELYMCIQEINSREEKLNYANLQEAEKYLEEATNILMYDVSAPDVIKQKWKLIKGN